MFTSILILLTNMKLLKQPLKRMVHQLETETRPKLLHKNTSGSIIIKPNNTKTSAQKINTKERRGYIANKN